MAEQYTFKIIILGDCNIGKSCLLNKYINNQIENKYSTTIGVDFGVKHININDSNIKLQIWDTAGQESFRSITRSFYRLSAGIILMYSINNRKSFENLSSWLNDINKELNYRNIPIFLIGNKCDLNNEREVTIQEGIKFAKENNMLFKEISIKNDNKSTKVFNILAEDIFNKIKNKQIKVNRMNGINQYVDFNFRSNDKRRNCCIIS